MHAFTISFSLFQCLLDQQSLAGIALRVVSITKPVCLVVKEDELVAFQQLVSSHFDRLAQMLSGIYWMWNDKGGGITIFFEDNLVILNKLLSNLSERVCKILSLTYQKVVLIETAGYSLLYNHASR